MNKLTPRLALAAASVALVSLGTTGAAFATGSPNDGATSTTQQQERTGGADGDQDQAAQDAACKRAGIDPSASNINYDDESDVCSLGGGADNESD